MLMMTIPLILFIASYFSLSFLQVQKGDFSLDEMIVDSVIPQNVQPSEIAQVYDSVTNSCEGAYLWNLSSDEIFFDSNMGYCQNEGYYSKLYGYTYDEEERVVLHVKVLKRVNHQLYRLNDTFVADYNEETLNDLLDEGTTYEYVVKKNRDQFEFAQVRFMKEE